MIASVKNETHFRLLTGAWVTPVVFDGVRDRLNALGYPSAVFSGETTYEPWRDIPCSYIICEQDQALPPPI
jgi:hypothetical protein